MTPKLPVHNLPSLNGLQSLQSLQLLPRTAGSKASIPSAGQRAYFASQKDGSYEQTKQRRQMFARMARVERLMTEQPEGPFYIGRGPFAPFPENPLFKSQPVLGEDAREMIWRRVVEDGQPLKVLSAEFGIDIRRVAAVVRLKQIEKRWIAEVCHHASSLSLFPTSAHMMICTKCSISHEDFTMVKTR